MGQKRPPEHTDVLLGNGLPGPAASAGGWNKGEAEWEAHQIKTMS
jgi:hypothetical protein